MRRHLLADRSWFLRWTVTVSVAEAVGSACDGTASS